MLSRERIENIRDAVKPDEPAINLQYRVSMFPDELHELCRLALHATDPDMVLVPREEMQRLYNFSRECSNGAVELENIFSDMEQERVFVPDQE